MQPTFDVNVLLCNPAEVHQGGGPYSDAASAALIGSHDDLPGRRELEAGIGKVEIHPLETRLESICSDLRRRRPSLIFLGESIGPVASAALCRLIKDDDVLRRAAVVVIGSRSSSREEVAAFNAGADEFIQRRIEPAALVARLQVLMRRANSKDDPSDDRYAEQVVRVGGIVIWPERYHVAVRGQAVQLTVAEFRLLLRLARHVGRVRSAEQLAEPSAGADASSPEKVIRTRISSLRRKLGPCAHQLKTVRQAGYQLMESPGTAAS